MTAADIQSEKRGLGDPDGLALAGLEAAIGLADHIDPAFAANHAAVSVPILQ